jgi:hypothetical protein
MYPSDLNLESPNPSIPESLNPSIPEFLNHSVHTTLMVVPFPILD